MTTNITNAWVEQFDSEVKLAFQRMGSLLRNTVRIKNNVVGNTVHFMTAGTGTAGGKDRHGLIPTMDGARTRPSGTMADRYASDYVDALDELGINHDERGVIRDTVVGALGRDTDTIILTEMATATATALTGFGTAAAFTEANTIGIMEQCGDADMPFDGNIFACVPWEGWGGLLAIDSFSSTDYTPGDAPFQKGVPTPSRHWLGINWFPHSGLLTDGTDDYFYVYHRSAMGHGMGADLSTSIWYDGNRDAYRVTGKMKHCSVKIDDLGVLQGIYDVSA